MSNKKKKKKTIPNRSRQSARSLNPVNRAGTCSDLIDVFVGFDQFDGEFS